MQGRIAGPSRPIWLRAKFGLWRPRTGADLSESYGREIAKPRLLKTYKPGMVSFCDVMQTFSETAASF
jgi:hypothetical protein